MDYDDQMVFALQILRAAPPVRVLPAAVPLPLRGRSAGYPRDSARDHRPAGAREQRQPVRSGRRPEHLRVSAAWPQALIAGKDLARRAGERWSRTIVPAGRSWTRPTTLWRAAATAAPRCWWRPRPRRPAGSGEDRPAYRLTWLFRQWRSRRRAAGGAVPQQRKRPAVVHLCERHGVGYRFNKNDLLFFSDKIVMDVQDFLEFKLPIPPQRPVPGRLLQVRAGHRPAARTVCLRPEPGQRPPHPGRTAALPRTFPPAAQRPARRGRRRRLPGQDGRPGAGHPAGRRRVRGPISEQKHMDKGKLSIPRLLAEQGTQPRPEGAAGGTARPAGRARRQRPRGRAAAGRRSTRGSWNATRWRCWMCSMASCPPCRNCVAARRRIPV